MDSTKLQQRVRQLIILAIGVFLGIIIIVMHFANSPYNPESALGLFIRWSSLLQLFVYLILAGLILLKELRMRRESKNVLDKTDFIWVRNIFLGITLMWLAYIIGAVWNFPGFIIWAVLYTFGVYLLTCILLTYYYDAVKPKEKYKDSAITPDQKRIFLEGLNRAIEMDQVHKMPNISLRGLAKELIINPNALSQVINENFNQNFPDFINTLRIKEAKNLLTPSNDYLKIASIASDCGFNTLSAFNAAFKKNTGLTPSEYRSQLNQIDA